MTAGKRCERGNAAVEFALSSTVLILSFAGAFQFGFGFYRYNMLESAVANGAKYASVRTYRCLRGETDVAKIRASVKNMVVYGTPTPTASTRPVMPGLDPGFISVQYTVDALQVPESVRVGIQTFTIDAVFKQFTFTGKPYVTFPYLGRYAPQESEP